MKYFIFYLDDEDRLLNIFQETFGDEYNIRSSTDVGEARRMLSECAADIIISDQSMPGITGTEFLREAAGACPESFRILLTGRVSVGEVITDMSTGTINLFISKPWTEAEMRLALERAVASLSLRRKTGQSPSK